MSNLPAIPDPQLTLESLRETVLALKEMAENFAGTRGPASTTVASVTALTEQGATLTQALSQAIDASAASLQAQIDAITPASIGAAQVQQTDFISGVIPNLANQDYRLVVNIPYACTINETTTRCTSGTATATFKVNTTALGGTANSVSTSEQTQAHTTSNSVVAGDDIVLTISSNSSAIFLSFTIKITRTLA